MTAAPIIKGGETMVRSEYNLPIWVPLGDLSGSVPGQIEGSRESEEAKEGWVTHRIPQRAVLPAPQSHRGTLDCEFLSTTAMIAGLSYSILHLSVRDERNSQKVPSAVAQGESRSESKPTEQEGRRTECLHQS